MNGHDSIDAIMCVCVEQQEAANDYPASHCKLFQILSSTKSLHVHAHVVDSSMLTRCDSCSGFDIPTVFFTLHRWSSDGFIRGHSPLRELSADVRFLDISICDKIKLPRCFAIIDPVLPSYLKEQPRFGTPRLRTLSLSLFQP